VSNVKVKKHESPVLSINQKRQLDTADALTANLNLKLKKSMLNMSSLSKEM
tara:strand:+ start:557 stop:709 length:153 start_codon:yes stop_codon:yes gene_type:complete